MRRLLSLVVVAVGLAAVPAFSDEPSNPKRLVVPDENKAAAKAIAAWLDSRAIDCELKENSVIFRWEDVLFTIHPFGVEKGLDRLVVNVAYRPKDEFKGAKEIVDLAAEQNRNQNFLKVYVANDGTYEVQGNLTFYDELTAHEFDAFFNLYAGVVKQYILTPDALKLLK